MKKTLFFSAIAAVMMGGITGYYNLKSSDSENISAITAANIEALTEVEGFVTIEYNKCCKDGTTDICVRNSGPIHYDLQPCD